MKNYFSKLRLVLLPFLLLNLGFTIVYLILYYILILHLELSINDKLISLFIPFGVIFLLVILFIRPRLKMLEIKNDRLPSLFYMVAGFMIFWTFIKAKDLVVTASTDVVSLTSFSQINQYPNERFYKINRFEVVNKFATSTYTVERTGKHNQHLDLDVYFTAPIAEIEKNIIPKNHRYWLTHHYSHQVSSRLSDVEIERSFNKFYNFSRDEFYKRRYLKNLDHFTRELHSDTKIQTISAIGKTIPDFYSKDIVVLSPSDKDLTKEARSSLKWMLISLISGVAFFSIILLFFRYDNSYKNRKAKKVKNEYQEFLRMAIPQKGFFATPLIGYLNIVLFLLLIFKADFAPLTTADLLKFGAVRRWEVTLDGEYWRLVSSIFLHGSFAHLIYNMIGLCIAGFFTEPVLGTRRFTILYILSGIAGAIASIVLNENTVSVGASGAIFGVFSALFVYAVHTKQSSIQYMVGIYAGISLFMGFIMPGTDNAGHLGGVICGALLYLCARKFNNKIESVKLTK